MPRRTGCVCFLIFCALDLAAGVCFDKDSTSTCQFRCRCKDDTTCVYTNGHCDSGCDSKWMGPSCQYGNLAYNGHVDGNLQGKELITDGDKTTCPPIYTHNNPFVYIDLKNNFTVQRLVIYNKDFESFQFRGLRVRISAEKNDLRPHSLCYETTATVDKDIIDVQCEKALVGRYILVESLGDSIHMPICEIEIYGGINGAYGRTTELYLQFDPNVPDKFSSRFAVNGIVTDFAHTRTGFSNPWWFVDFKTDRSITRIRLYYRNGGSFGRLNGFTLEIQRQGNWVFRDIINGGGLFVDISVPSINGDKVKLFREGSGFTLNVAEVEVYFSCTDGFFGLDCYRCNCYNRTEICDSIYGRCISGCQLGYNGDNCLIECSDGKFGRDCQYSCNCQDPNEACEKSLGHCTTSGCKKGYGGDGCQHECPDKTFGSNCTHTCNCYDPREVCNKTDGHCGSGCKSGYRGDGCLQECDDKTFGRNCTHTCNCNDADEVCDKSNGKCDKTGCKIGYAGYGCLHECGGKTFGQNCVNTCNCNNTEEVCHKTDGYCKSSCKSGYRGIGCLQECENYHFGFNCTGVCNCNDTEEVCHKINGHCETGCRLGYGRYGCLQECIDKTFGSNCPYTCKCQDPEEVCNKTDGHCTSGCKNGYEGDGCQREIKGTKDDNNTPAIIGAVLGVLLAIIILAVLLFIWRRRRRRKSNKQQRSSPIRDVLYENSNELGKKSSRKPTSTKKAQGSAMGRPVNDIDGPIYEPAEEVVEKEPLPVARDGQQYYNVGLLVSSKTSIPVDDLWNYVSKMNQDAFKAEFVSLPDTLVKPYESAKANMVKNRYRGIYAYDHTRVKLSPPNEDGCDYMNANYIEGYHRSRKFIASQGTTKDNILDFWLMIWQQKCSAIVMLTNLIEEGKDKCLRYWPKEDEHKTTFGSVEVALQKEEVFCNFTMRSLRISKDGESRIVKQYHFTAWPDKGVPAYSSSLVQFHKKVKSCIKDRNHPMVVHCSAGIGRTGTFISLDYLIDEAKADSSVNVFGCVQKLREQRVNMIQTLDQYIFLHTALVEALHCKGHSMPSDEFRQLYEDIKGSDGNRVLEDDFRKLEAVYSGYDVKFTAGKKPENIMKNRDQSILPADSERPMLTPDIPGCDDYINAVFLPGLRKRRQFLVTQTPLENTVIDFWRMIYQHETRVIVDLSSDPENYDVFPDRSELNIGPITVTSVSKEHDPAINSIVQTLTVSRREAYSVMRLKPQFWSLRSNVPKDVPVMMKFIYEVDKLGQFGLNGGIVVICPDGATRCGLFCSAFVSLDRLRVEQEVGTGQIIKQYRSIRPHIIPNKEQLKYCYDILMFHLKENETYSNFA